MKKAILTIGLFSMVMVLTSFTSNEPGGQQVPASRNKLEAMSQGGGQQVPASRNILELEFEPGGNGQQVPKQRPSLD